LLAFAALFASALAQQASIYYPAAGSTISTGSQTVQVNRQSSTTGSREIDLVISIAPCHPDGTCDDPASHLGTTLYVGPFNPQYPTPPYNGNYGIQQNFTVDIPEALAGQKAVLSVVYFALLG
ncbi:hypothetical protein PENSPDRAFT_558742, partial [Peniophora sp. CONT]